ncbi:MAG TPA: methylaspartate mutase accessory protein GlmL [Candidatus Binatia bacterium]|nr:methylaspartate mutase accessory protein GlmL [Candidatus Binatia bacterium]
MRLNSLAILIDFGSTFTKVTAIDLRSAQLVGTGQSPSTVRTDVCEGLLQALIAMHERRPLFDHRPTDLNVLQDKLVLASSSAAGGLRIVVIGLVPGLTVEAANHAALGAGAKVVGSLGFKLAASAINEIGTLRPDIILLTGGADGGDSGTIVHNARVLADSTLSVPIIVAGNSEADAELGDILRRGRKEFRSAGNVMPKTGTLAVESARAQIRQLFMERITRAKGLDRIRPWAPVVLPTPMAVLEAVRLGAEGVEKKRGWGEILAVDVGGATTDVHSIGCGEPKGENVIARGLAEPFAKRTVEGDLGIRYNAATLLYRAGLDRLAAELRAAFPEFTVSDDALSLYIEEIGDDTSGIPRQPWHFAADAVLARVAVELAVARHVGRRERIITREGEVWVHYGKDLRDTPTLIGTGGVFVHNPYASYILSRRAERDERSEVLRPKKPKALLDSSYLLYAVGLLAQGHPDISLKVFEAHMKPVELSG